MATPLKKRIMRLFSALFVAYVAVGATLYVGQRAILYPAMQDARSPQDVGLPDMQEAMMQRPDAAIQVWFQPASAPNMPVIVYFHGNAGSLASRAPRIRAFTQRGFGMALMAYRGYGKSEGSPSQQAIMDDAAAFMEFLQAQYGVKASETLVYGESLGTGVAVQLAAQNEVAGVVLQSGFTSVRARSQASYPWLPVRYLLHDPYDSLAIIGDVRVPLLLIHGTRDNVIPHTDSQALYAAATQAHSREVRLLDGVGHNDMDPDALAEMLADFWAANAGTDP
jgi:uncharacterized protein